MRTIGFVQQVQADTEGAIRRRSATDRLEQQVQRRAAPQRFHLRRDAWASAAAMPAKPSPDFSSLAFAMITARSAPPAVM